MKALLPNDDENTMATIQFRSKTGHSGADTDFVVLQNRNKFLVESIPFPVEVRASNGVYLGIQDNKNIKSNFPHEDEHWREHQGKRPFIKNGEWVSINAGIYKARIIGDEPVCIIFEEIDVLWENDLGSIHVILMNTGECRLSMRYRNIPCFPYVRNGVIYFDYSHLIPGYMKEIAAFYLTKHPMFNHTNY